MLNLLGFGILEMLGEEIDEVNEQSSKRRIKQLEEIVRLLEEQNEILKEHNALLQSQVDNSSENR